MPAAFGELRHELSEPVAWQTGQEKKRRPFSRACGGFVARAGAKKRAGAYTTRPEAGTKN